MVWRTQSPTTDQEKPDMFKSAKHILAAAAVVVIVAAPSSAFADPPPSSGSAPTVSEITVTKRADASSPKLFQTSVTGKYIAPAK
jgi:Type VI secretion system effector, Hcp